MTGPGTRKGRIASRAALADEAGIDRIHPQRLSNTPFVQDRRRVAC